MDIHSLVWDIDGYLLYPLRGSRIELIAGIWEEQQIPDTKKDDLPDMIPSLFF